MNNQPIIYNLQQIDNMEGHEFEYTCADILRKNGFYNVIVTRGSGDFGVDIVAERKGLRYAIQCKRYNHKLNNSSIQEVIAGMSSYNCNAAAVMTNQYFTEPAKELARRNNVFLWDRNVLSQMISNITPNVLNPRHKMSAKHITIISILSTIFWALGSIVMFTDKDLSANDRIGGGITFSIFSMFSGIILIYMIFKYFKSHKKQFVEQKNATTNNNDIQPITEIDAQETKNITDNSNAYVSSKSNKELLFKRSLADEQLQVLNAIDHFKKCKETLQQSLTHTCKYILNFYSINAINIEIVNIDTQLEYEEMIFEIKLIDKKIRTAQIKKSTHDLALHLGVDYVKYDFPTSTKGTVGLRMPLPPLILDDIKLVNKYSKKHNIQI